MNLSLNTNDGVSFYKVTELWVHPLFLNLVIILKGRNHKKISISPLVFEDVFLPIFSCIKFISNSEITQSSRNFRQFFEWLRYTKQLC